MGVSIESIGRMNPYWRANGVVVTSSPFKQGLYGEAGIQVESDPSKIHHVGNGETNHDSMNGHGVVIRRRMVDVPYPVLVANAKINELRPHFPPNGHSHITADSTWEVMDGNEHVHSFNKPLGDRHKEEEILQTFNHLRGERISSDTGIAVLPNTVLPDDLHGVELYHTSLLVGTVNPQLDMGKMEAIVRSNPSTSAGFSILDAIQGGIIIPDPMIQFRIRRIKPHGSPQTAGSIMRYETFMSELSSDSSNNSWLKKLTVGVLPRK